VYQVLAVHVYVLVRLVRVLQYTYHGKFIDEVVAECEMPEAARKAAASKIMRAIGIEVMHKQAYMMATLVQELRNEAHGVPW
jgi:hypothetical protein